MPYAGEGRAPPPSVAPVMAGMYRLPPPIPQARTAMTRRLRFPVVLTVAAMALVPFLGGHPLSAQDSPGLDDPPGLQALVDFRRGESDLRTAIQ